ncbi:nucleotide pyrophosphohydrolase [uncultured Methanobrevibacter sp.]|uniref:nucleotide pyrophosphohydrolase n=1 Tax=uncultured Methanobrevibacter sp. TaxID=253161 RepID=UPI0025E6CDB7|nr:nucleotide pyrophosphohydrolase [uncultured Methanobrevibacter sp.]
MDELMNDLIEFQRKRDWKKFHTPENLAKSISIESGELLEHFQWGKEYDKLEVADELADVLIYCLYMVDVFDFDFEEIIRNKMAKNAVKYPEKIE